jgi:hypothetical protein
VGDTKENAMGIELRSLEKRQDLVRIRPQGKDQWTFQRQGKGRSIPDHLSVQTELQAIITNVKIIHDPTFGSDHKAIDFEIIVPVQDGKRLEQAEPRVFWNTIETESREAQFFKEEVEQWAAKWLEETERDKVDWSDRRIINEAYESLIRRLLESAEKHIGEKTVWRKWGKSERARDLKHRLKQAGKSEAEAEDEERKEETLRNVKDYCVNLHRETEEVKSQQERERAKEGETDRNAHFRTINSSHWKLKKGTPGIIKDGEELICDPGEGLKVWAEAMHNTMEVTAQGLLMDPPAGQERGWEVEFGELMKEAEKADSIEPNQEDIDEVVRALGKKGAPGGDKLTGMVFRLMGPVLDSIVRRLLEMLLFQGSSPEAWRKAVIVPVWKKGDTLDATNYRPVVLLAKLYKAIERALLKRVNKAVMNSGGLHSTNLAYQKGKGREMALFVLIGSILHRKFNWPNSSTFICLLDVQHAYNGVNLHRLGLDLWERGVRGKVWKLIMEMILNLRYTVRVNGRSSWDFEGAGVPQGATLSPKQFIIFKDGLAWALQECGAPGVGVTLENGAVIVGVFWSDDDAILAETEVGMRTALKEVAEFSASKRVRYHGLTKGKEGKVMEFGRMKGQIRKFKMGKVWVKEVDEGLFLGRKIAKPKIEGRDKDVTEALEKAWRKVFMMKWAGAFTGECSLTRVALLYDSLMFSIVRSHLGMLQISESNYENVLVQQCKLFKWWGGTGMRVNKVFLLAELGLWGADLTLKADKLLLHDCMKALRAGAAVRSVAECRVRDALAGDDRGLSAEALRIWQQWGGAEREFDHWESCGTETRKKMIREKARRQDKMRWKETHDLWHKSHHLRWRCQSKWGSQKYLKGRGSREGKGLKCLFRGESAALRGNASGVKGTSKKCTCGKVEDEVHIVVVCTELSTLRTILMKEVEDTLEGKQWEAWLRINDREQAAILLGAGWGLSDAQEASIDLATQTFLCESERLRVGSLGLPSFRSRVGQGARDGPGDPTGEEVDLLCKELDEVIEGNLWEEKEED